MGLHWDWSDKMGEVTDKNGWTANLYRGNAFMIALNEWDDEEGGHYSLAWFFANEAHCKNCLGLTKGYDGCDFNWDRFKLNTEYKETYKFITLLAKAKFKDITIELY